MPNLTGLDLPFPFYAVSAFILGLIFGSFLNVVIYRTPQGLSVVSPGSHCAACGAPVRAFDNIPLVSFALLGGRCRSCRARISLTYPTVELLTGAIFVALVFRTGPSWDVLLEFAFACVMIALIFTDAQRHLIPNVITYPAFLFALIGATARAGWGEQIGPTFDITIIVPGLHSEFTPWRAALLGGSLFAMAAPGFWLLDRLDPVLFGKYYDWEESDENPPGRASLPATGDSADLPPEATLDQESSEDAEAERRQCRVIRATMILGLIVAGAWAAMVISSSAKNLPATEDAYGGLLRASAGALIFGGLMWCIRASFFLIRKFEGMGLGDIKMMSAIGAFLGWIGAFSVMLLGSIIGVIAGLVLIFRSKRGFRTPMPFGACLGIASLIVMSVAGL
jgi:prepilin signal peptidase PulO-like enzyme (type II secretory pathway)